MALQDSIRDHAVALAKRTSQPEVTAQHVLAGLAIALRDRGLVDNDAVERATSVLPAAGGSIEPPAFGPEADELVDKCTSPEAAVALLKEHLGGASTTDNGDAAQPSDGSSTNESNPSAAKAELLAEALDDLDRLIGLSEVKDQVNRLVAVQKVNGARAAQGKKPLPASLHLVFTGAPGTGKTSVARIIARIYQGLGLLPNGHLVETDRSGLVGGYVGQTALKTNEVVAKAKGGVLFIDEAYSLAGQSEQDFGPEAIAALVKQMEDLRGQLAVIVAGYEDEMRLFVESNPGLQSRFQTFIAFPEYSKDELVEIFHLLANENEIGVPEDVADKVRQMVSASRTDGSGGNARFVRALFEDMAVRLAHRAAEDGTIEDHEINDFAVDDVPEARTQGMRTPAGFRP